MSFPAGLGLTAFYLAEDPELLAFAEADLLDCFPADYLRFVELDDLTLFWDLDDYPRAGDFELFFAEFEPYLFLADELLRDFVTDFDREFLFGDLATLLDLADFLPATLLLLLLEPALEFDFLALFSSTIFLKGSFGCADLFCFAALEPRLFILKFI